MSQADLNNALSTLIASSWLTKSGAGDKASYKVNLKQRSASTLPSRIWNALEKKLKKEGSDFNARYCHNRVHL